MKGMNLTQFSTHLLRENSTLSITMDANGRVEGGAAAGYRPRILYFTGNSDPATANSTSARLDSLSSQRHS